MQAELGQEHLLFLCVHARDVLLELGADRQHHRALRIRDRLHGLEALVLRCIAGKAGLVHIGGVDHLFSRQQVAFVHHADNVLVLAKALEGAGGLALLKVRLERLEDLHVLIELFIRLGGLARALEAALQMLDIREDELEVDGFDVARRVDRALDMHDVVIVKAAHHVDDRVHLSDMGQELVAQALALARAAHQARDVHELHDRRGGLFRVVQVGQRLEPLVRHGDHADVGVDRAEGIVCALRARLRDRIEQGGLAYVREPDNAEFHRCHSSK